MVERWIYSVVSISTLGFIGYIIFLIFGSKENARMAKFIALLSIVVITMQIIGPATRSVTGFFGKVDNSLARIDRVLLTGSGGWELPVSGGKISQKFNGVDHHGLDIAIPEGTPVKAAQDGKVSRVEWSNIL